jgi:peptidoglycan hydrolase-like protein with peptidoglycan-binding domain
MKPHRELIGALISTFVALSACGPGPAAAPPPASTNAAAAPSVATTGVAPTSAPPATPTIAPTPTPELPDWPLFQKGDWNMPEVFALQRLMRYHGVTLIADGMFGGQTEAAVKAVQAKLHVPADGLVGPITWGALVKDVSVQEGDTGEAVRAAQYLLNKFGNDITVDGNFGPDSVAALNKFKASVGLSSDGVVDVRTWQALVSVKP